MSVISQTYSLIIDRGISAPGQGKEVADGINAVDKRLVQITVANFDAQPSNDVNHFKMFYEAVIMQRG